MCADNRDGSSSLILTPVHISKGRDEAKPQPEKTCFMLAYRKARHDKPHQKSKVLMKLERQKEREVTPAPKTSFTQYTCGDPRSLMDQDRTLFSDINQELLNNSFSFLQVHERHAFVGKMSLILDVIPHQAASMQSNTDTH